MADEAGDVQLKKQPFSFQIKKKVENKPRVEKPSLQGSFDALGDDKSKADFVLYVEDKHIASAEPEEVKKEVVIPLIKKNVWRFPKKPSELEDCESLSSKDITKENVVEENDKQKDGRELSLDELAAKELVEETQKKTNEKERSEEIAIPLVMQNKVPDGFETDDKMDVQLRPDESTLIDYERVPVEEYGLAVLRGMGWKPGDPIGRTNKQCVKPVEAKVRPKGLGLGADARVLQEANNKHVKKEAEDEDLKLTKGSYARIRHGQHKGMYGQVEGWDEENARIVIKLALGNKIVSVPEFVVQTVSKKEYTKEAKCINNDKYEKVKRKQEEEREEEDKKRKSRRSSHSDEERHSSSDGRTRHRKSSHERNSSRERSHDHKDTLLKSSSWVQPQLRVRFIDEDYKKGRYFNTKMVVEEILPSDCCSCRTEEGKLLDNIHMSMLETVVPRKDPMVVMVVQGKYKGYLGKIMERDKASCIATVQLFSRSKKKTVKLEYDSICEFVGPLS